MFALCETEKHFDQKWWKIKATTYLAERRLSGTAWDWEMTGWHCWSWSTCRFIAIIQFIHAVHTTTANRSVYTIAYYGIYMYAVQVRKHSSAHIRLPCTHYAQLLPSTEQCVDNLLHAGARAVARFGLYWWVGGRWMGGIIFIFSQNGAIWVVFWLRHTTLIASLKEQ